MSYKIFKPKYKLLLVFDLNCVLGYRQFNKAFDYEMKGLSRSTPHIKENGYSTIYRPNFETIMFTLFQDKKDMIDVGIWANQSKEETGIQVQQFFRSLKFNVNFILYTDNTNKEYINHYKNNVSNPEECSKLIPHPIKRDLNLVFKKNPEYTASNTFVISNFENLDKRFVHNDIILPLYHPKGTTNNSTDFYLFTLQEYIKLLIGMHESDNGKNIY